MQLSETQRQIRETARAFAARAIAPFAADWDRQEGAPRSVLREMADVGLMGVTVDPAWGGAGADFVSYALALEEISAADGGISNMMAANNSPVAAAIEEHGTGRQKAEYLTKITSGA
ncbi:MAG: acyl-CoA dehydrogenase family protein, partial [Rhodospirillaceae bacterium]|nr:acyl-CoA dehydrogenase family protein [Rhodospirillaceae bacterium]